jgi:hypothetical protein
MAGLTQAERAILAAVVDRIVPPDQHKGGAGLGADRFVSGMLDGELAAEAPGVAAGLGALGAAFVAATPADQDAALARVAGQAWFGLLCELVQEGVYADPGNGGNEDGASWRMIGYEPRLPEPPAGPAPQPRQPPRVLGASGVLDYDVIVIGAGAAGGVMACKLAEGGRSVLLLERGREVSYAHDGHRDHLRNHRLSAHGHNTGPDITGNPRVYVDLDGTEHTVPPHHGLYMNNASGVGSATVVYGAQAWRFHPDDFRMASLYGVPDGSSLVDWPIGYDELAPYYGWIEWEMGVSGEGGTGGYRARGYPMPAVRQFEKAALLKRGGEALGIETMAPPLLINTMPHGGRAACIECGSCVGFPCPSDAKTGTQNTMIPRALATGRTTLVTGAMVERIEADPAGMITGVSYLAEDGSGGLARRTAHAKAVVVSAGAIETARLLLQSGLGNAHDQVGRNLQGHYYPVAYGRFDADVHTSRGPGVTIATTSFAHGNKGVIGGAMLADEFVMLPAIFVKFAVPPTLPRWGAPLKDFTRSLPPCRPDHRAGSGDPGGGLPGDARRHHGPLRTAGGAAVRGHACGDRPYRRVHPRARGGLAARFRRGRDVEHAAGPAAFRGAASGRNLPHGDRPRTLGDRQQWARLGAPQSLRIRREPSPHQRGVQPRAHHHGNGGAKRRSHPDGLAVRPQLISLVRMQALLWSGPMRSSGGTTSAHLSIAKGHRVRKTQPEGGLAGLGISPTST